MTLPQPARPRQPLLVLCQLFYPELVSTGQTLTELCVELTKLGWDIEVVCAAPTILRSGAPTPKDLVHEGVKVHRVWATRFPKLSLVGRVANQLTYSLSTILFLVTKARSRPILVLTNPPFLPFACIFAKLFHPRLRLALLVFDVYPDTAIHLGLLSKGGWVARLWEWLNILSFKASRKIIVLGRCMREVILEKGRQAGIDLTSKVETIHIWSDDQLIEGSQGELPPVLKGHGLEDKFLVLYSGNMGRFHDLETILDAALVLKDHPSIRFAFIGEGAKKQKVIDTIARHQLENCIVDTYVPKEDLGKLLCSAQVGLTSLLIGQEGLSVPSKTLGLMAAAVPVVAIMSPASEIALLVEEHGFGVVLQPGEVDKLVSALTGLYATPERCREMGGIAQRLVSEKLSLTRAAKEYSRVLTNF